MIPEIPPSAPTDLDERRERVAALCREGLGVATIARLRVTRMTNEQKARAADLFADGCSRKEVARTVGVTSRTLQRHFPGQCWTGRQVGQFSMANRYNNWRIT